MGGFTLGDDFFGSDIRAMIEDAKDEANEENWERKMEKDPKAEVIKGWYRRSMPNGQSYFTTFPTTKKIYDYPGTGTAMPTPKEAKEYLDRNPDADYNIFGVFSEDKTEETRETGIDLPGGCYFYEPATPQLPPRLGPMDLRTDQYHVVPGAHDAIVTEVRDFLASEKVYREMGDQFRRGIMTYGPPGNSKTSTIRRVILHEIPKDVVVIFLEKMPPKRFWVSVAKTLPHRLKVIVFEEMATILADERLERVLDFLDGENSLDRCLIIATTNYPERLPQNIVDRPSRFDRLIRFPDPDDKGRKAYLQRFLPGVDIGEKEIELTKGLSVAGLKEVARLVRMRGTPLDKACKAMKEHREKVKKEFSESQPIGLHASRRMNYDEDY